MNPLLCTVCNVQCDTAANYHAHVLSKKHIYKLDAARAPTHDLFCVHCQKHTDNRANFIAHNASKAHLSRLAELGIPTTQPATSTTPRIVVDMTIDDDDDWFTDQPALVIDTQPVVQPLSTPRPPVTPALSIWATPPTVTRTTAPVTATLPVVESPTVKPRSVQVVALPSPASPAVFATKKAPVVAATLPVVESPAVKPRSVQVVALPPPASPAVFATKKAPVVAAT